MQCLLIHEQLLYTYGQRNNTAEGDILKLLFNRITNTKLFWSVKRFLLSFHLKSFGIFENELCKVSWAYTEAFMCIKLNM